MHLLIVTHGVEDYDRFKAVFDDHPPAQGGAVFHRVCRDIDDPDRVTIIAGFDARDQAVAWRDDPELRTAIGAAGIVGAPHVTVVEVVDAVGV